MRARIQGRSGCCPLLRGGSQCAGKQTSPIAVAGFAAAGLLPADLVVRTVHIGAGLDGSVRPVRGVLPADNAAEAGARAADAGAAGPAPIQPGSPLPHAGQVRGGAGRAGRRSVVGEPESVPDMRDVVGRTRRSPDAGDRGGGWPTTSSRSDRLAARQCWPSGFPGYCRPGAHHVLEVTAIQSPLRVLVRSRVLVSRHRSCPHHGASMAAVIGAGSGCTRPSDLQAASVRLALLGCGRRPPAAGHDN